MLVWLILPAALLLLIGCAARDQRSLKRFNQGGAGLVVLVPAQLGTEHQIDLGVARSSLAGRLEYDHARLAGMLQDELLEISAATAEADAADGQSAGVVALTPLNIDSISVELERDEYLALLSSYRAVALNAPLEGDEPLLLWEEPAALPRGGRLIPDEQSRVPGPGIDPAAYRAKHGSITKRGGLGVYSIELRPGRPESRVYRGLDLEAIARGAGQDFVTVVDLAQLELVYGNDGMDLRYCFAVIVVDLHKRRGLVFVTFNGNARGADSLPGPELARIADLDEARQGAVQRGLDLLAQRSAARCAAAIGLLNADDLKTLGQMWSLQNMSILESLGLPIAGGL